MCVCVCAFACVCGRVGYQQDVAVMAEAVG